MYKRKYTSKNDFHKLEKRDNIVIQKGVFEENSPQGWKLRVNH